MSELSAKSPTRPVMDIEAIQKILPHRYPFLLVDRVISLDAGKRIIAVKNVSRNEPFFEGHFPGHSVMPGVLIVEALAQAGALLAFTAMAEAPVNKVCYLSGIDNARFRKPVVPGDQLELHVELVRQKGRVFKKQARAMVDGQVVAEVELLAILADRGSSE